MTDGPIRTIAVVGDGIAGWMAAAAFARRVPGARVALVPGGTPGLADRFGGTTPAVHDFHRDLRIDTRDLLVRTGGALRLGTRFEGYVHAFGPVGTGVVNGPFSAAWCQMRDAGPFDAYSPCAQLGLAGKVPDSDPMFEAVSFGLQLDPAAHRAYLAGYAEHVGVAVTAARAVNAIVAEGRVTAIRLDDGTQLIADLYVDATNAEALLISALDDGNWRDWSRWLPADSVARTNSAPDVRLPSLDHHAGIAGGWRLTTSLPGRTDHALIYDRDVLDDDEAARLLGRDVAAPFRFRSGRRARGWIANVVAIGDAHVVVEPLEAAPLHILHTQIDRLITSLPGRDFAGVEIANYNRETNEEADRLRDFLIAHRRDPPDPPAELADTLALFTERGRWRQRDGEGFSRDDWQAVLFGLGIRPRLLDPVTQVANVAQCAADLASFRQRIAAAVARAPTHREHLESMKQ